jgi:penicillin amidase
VALMREETLRIAGLSAPAEIAVDYWGIPHIRAETQADLFFVQGFNAARDRLWQLDLWRKRGLGLLAADFGPGYLEQDRAARLFLYRGDMAAEWAAYGDDAQAVCAAFVAGINAYVALTEREPGRLPPEFGVLGTRPARWAADDVVRIRSHGLTRNALSEVVRSNVLARADAATDLLRKNLEPPATPKIPDGLPLGAVPIAALDLFRLAQAHVTFSQERLACPLDRAGAWRKVDEWNEVLIDAAWEGSNNWAVHGSRTDTGLPILASDPHRQHAVPSLRYVAHLTMPGFDAIGAGEAVVPGLSLGHNGSCAFGLTIFCADQEDVYVLDLDPKEPGRYRFGDGYEPLRIVEEAIAVKGHPDQTVPLAFARQGPVLWRDDRGHRAVVVRSVWFEPGAAPYLRSLKLMRAPDVATFTRDAKRWGAPSANLVAADRRGHIAWMPVGFVPNRPHHDGLLPVPGDGRYEWAGMLDPDLLPVAIDPPTGFVHSANEMNLPAAWNHDTHKVGFEWTERSRASRIAEVLGAAGTHTLAASRALQTDTVSIPARRLCALLPKRASDPDAAMGLDLFDGWDHTLDAASAPAALHEVWWTKHLKPALLARFAPDENVRRLLAPGDVDGLLPLLERPDARWGANPAAERDALLVATLAAAMREGRDRLGAYPPAWAWGTLHAGYFEHALTNVRGNAAWDVGPLPKGGSASTPMYTGYRPLDFRITHGASFRMIVDLADLDRSVTLNAPGQSGDPRSPHYRDLAETWSRGGYVPMLYTRPAIDAATQTLIRLEPA